VQRLMNYLEAKTVLLKDSRPIPLTLIAVEAVSLVALAAVLVRFFA
jgi:hypothetical protein